MSEISKRAGLSRNMLRKWLLAPQEVSKPIYDGYHELVFKSYWQIEILEAAAFLGGKPRCLTSPKAFFTGNVC